MIRVKANYFISKKHTTTTIKKITRRTTGARGYKFELFRLSQSIWDYLGLSGTIWDYLGLSGTMWDYLGLYQTMVQVEAGESKFIAI